MCRAPGGMTQASAMRPAGRRNTTDAFVGICLNRLTSSSSAARHVTYGKYQRFTFEHSEYIILTAAINNGGAASVRRQLEGVRLCTQHKTPPPFKDPTHSGRKRQIKGEKRRRDGAHSAG